jgi:hypothetical protein
MKSNVQSNSQKQPLITYYPNGNVQIYLDCILTPDHLVHQNMLLIKVEGTHVDIVNLISVRNTQDMVYLKIMDMKTKNVHEISQRLDHEENYFVWWIISYSYINAAVEDRVLGELKGTVN